MKHGISMWLSSIGLVGTLSGCNGLWLDTYWRSERYVLLAVDAKSQMGLSFDLGNGTAMGLVGATVFSLARTINTSS